MYKKEDFEELLKRFYEFGETAEQRWFPLMYQMEMGLLNVINHFNEVSDKIKENTYKNIDWFLGGMKDD